MSEESKPHVVKSHDIRLDSDYVSWVHDCKAALCVCTDKIGGQSKYRAAFL